MPGGAALMLTASMLTLAGAVEVRGRDVRVRDLLRDAKGLPYAGVGSELIALRLKNDRTVVLRPKQAAALLRRRVPGLIFDAVKVSTVRISTSPAAAASPKFSCFEASRAIEIDAAIARDDVATTECRGSATPAIRYEQGAGGAVAAAAIKQGAYLGRLSVGPSRSVSRGTVLTLRSTTGPVTVERTVTTMQAGRSGRSTFVRDDRGAIFAAPLVLEDAR